MDNNEFNYNTDTEFKTPKVKKGNGLGKTVVIPLVSGIVGASLVMGTCFCVPTIKNKLLKTNSTFVSAPTTTNNLEIVNLADFSDTSIGVAQKVLPSVVGITIKYNVNSFFGMSEAEATGSGIIISEDGYIVTNNHVISSESSSTSYYQITEATGITVKLYNDSTEYSATVVGTDSYTDLAVLKIDANGLTPATIGNSDDVKVGEFAMAIGNPLGMDYTVTSGIISAVNREVSSDDGTSYTAIQTDAAINSGNSGGALVNYKGEVIGINTLKLAGNGIEGIGFAIPINSTTNIISQLIEFKTVKRPSIGISVSTVTDKISQRYNIPVGIYVEEVTSGGPAEKANLKVGDIITKFNGTEVKTVEELNKIKNNCNIGDEITLTIYSSNEYKDVKVKLEELEEAESTTNTTPQTQSNNNNNNNNNKNNQYQQSPYNSGSIFDYFFN